MQKLSHSCKCLGTVLIQQVFKGCLQHRDLKPENCVIETATMTLKVIDFGLAKHLESAATLGIGTPVSSARLPCAACSVHDVLTPAPP